jgi:hypothetical protein
MIECMKRFCGKIYRRKGLVIAYIRAIKDKKEGASISVRRQDGDTDDFPITIGLHQGSTLSPYLFTLVLDVLMYGTHPRASVEMYAFCSSYSPTWRVGGRN